MDSIVNDNFMVEFTQTVFGTNPLVTVRKGDFIIGSCNPFTKTQPVNRSQRNLYVELAVQEIIKGYKETVQVIN